MKKIIKTYAIAAILVVTLPNFLSAQTLDEAIKHLDAERFVAATQAFNKLAETSATTQTLFYKGYAILKSPEGITPESLKNAQDAFEKGNTLDKKGDPLNQIGLGMVKLASKDFAGAKLIFDEVKKATKSKNTDVLYRIAEAYTMFPNANDPAEAILNIDLALEKSKIKDNPEYYFVKSDAGSTRAGGGSHCRPASPRRCRSCERRCHSPRAAGPPAHPELDSWFRTAQTGIGPAAGAGAPECSA